MSCRTRGVPTIPFAYWIGTLPLSLPGRRPRRPTTPSATSGKNTRSVGEPASRRGSRVGALERMDAKIKIEIRCRRALRDLLSEPHSNVIPRSRGDDEHEGPALSARPLALEQVGVAGPPGAPRSRRSRNA